MLHVADCKHRTQKLSKIRHLSTIAQLFPAVDSQLGHVLITGKNIVKQQYLLRVFKICRIFIIIIIIWPTNS